MYTIRLSGREIVLAVLAAPVVIYAIYIAWLVVPVVVREVVPEVVQAVLGK